MKKRRWIFLGLSIFWMGLIFYLSSMESPDSQDMSYRVGETVCRLLIPGFSKMNWERQFTWIQNIDFFVRKTAHATEYMILTILLFLTLKEWKFKHPIRIAMLLAVLYAMTDEFHQLFVVGRAGQLRDVGIDSIGVVLAALLVRLSIFFFYRRSRNNI